MIAEVILLALSTPTKAYGEVPQHPFNNKGTHSPNVEFQQEGMYRCR